MAVSSVERDAWKTHERSVGWFASVCNWAKAAMGYARRCLGYIGSGVARNCVAAAEDVSAADSYNGLDR